ncbi:MAG: GNAT family N-acetyltransferase [Clostridiales bacterium]|nr:GNAT family N-acetyltransferase [Clostridiales bacterium]
MVIISLLEKKDAENIMKIYQECFDSAFQIQEDKLNQSVFDASDFCGEASLIAKDENTGETVGCIVIKLSDNQQLYPNTAWITLLLVKPEYRRRGIGRCMYEKSEKVLRDKGVHKIYIGQDFANLFSGIPSPQKENEEFFRMCGFILNKDKHYDLEADIVNNKKIDDFNTVEFEKEFITDILENEDSDRLLTFLREEFPGRWEYEAETYLGNKGKLENIVILKNRTDSGILGYCMLAVHEDRSGGLGPIGIAHSIRGRRVGDYILSQSLLQLRRLGAEKVCIDWTILKDFYGQFDFLPVRTFRSGYKEF